MIRIASSSNMDNRRIANNKEPTTEIVYGSDKVVDRFVQFMQKIY